MSKVKLEQILNDYAVTSLSFDFNFKHTPWPGEKWIEIFSARGPETHF